MISSLSVFESTCHDAHRNLAIEQYLLETVAEGECILYLWQNADTVVIGRNQNPRSECALTAMEKDGCTLARRLSGGGAVFHDLGNLNFTFIMPQVSFDLDRQLRVIEQAVCSLGIDARRSGRNDILASGRKFSGNAFYKNGKQAYHHGTLLVCSHMERLGQYLTPSRAKLQSKGVSSVKSRVVNLQDLKSDVTIDALKSALVKAFAHVYGLTPKFMDSSPMDEGYIRHLTERNGSWDWLYGRKMPFSWENELRFDWGSLGIMLQIESGVIVSAKVYSDAMDHTLAEKTENALTGCRFTRDDIAPRLAALPAEDILKTLEL